jgi:Ser-tRNA(Ala) deacylase AlaX
MHTAEHILNATMDAMFGCGRCFRAHIEKKKSKCDYHFDRSLTAPELDEIMARVNAVIRRDLTIREVYLPREQAARQFDLGRLPPDAPEMLRIIHIGDYDACPCIGPHVSTTGRIGAFRIVSSTFADGVLRLRYRLQMPQGRDGGEPDDLR